MADVQRFDWTDLGYTGLATVEGISSRVEWRVLEIVVFEPHIGWWPRGGVTAFPEATDPERGEVVVSICVRAGDGCADFAWKDGECTHTCGLEGTRKFAEMLVRVVETTPSVLA